MTPRQPRPGLHDWLALLYMKAAKVGRERFAATERTQYYQAYFQERHLAQYQADVLADLRRAEISRYLANLSGPLTVVDVGCGVGDILQSVGHTHLRVGLDYSVHSLGLARKRDAYLLAVNGSAYTLPFGDDSVDVVISLETLEHLEDDRAAVREIARILRPGGRLIVCVPHEYYFPEYLPLTGHYRHYTRRSLEQLLANASLRVAGYLNNYPRFFTWYRYIYAVLAVANRVTGRLVKDGKTVYERHLPGSSRTLYGVLRAWLLDRWAVRDRGLDLETLDTSTFVVATKNPSSDTRLPAASDSRVATHTP